MSESIDAIKEILKKEGFIPYREEFDYQKGLFFTLTDAMIMSITLAGQLTEHQLKNLLRVKWRFTAYSENRPSLERIREELKNLFANHRFVDNSKNGDFFSFLNGAKGFCFNYVGEINKVIYEDYFPENAVSGIVVLRIDATGENN